MNLLNKLFSNDFISNNIASFNFLRNDFTGISINVLGVLHFAFNVFLTGLIFFNFYYIGDLIRKGLKSKNTSYSPFVNIVLGNICIGLLLAFLGIFHLIYYSTIVLLILVATIISCYRFYILVHHKKLLSFLRNKKIKYTTDVFSWIVVIVISLSFIRLLLPEIHEDGYHTDLAKLYFSSHTITHEARDSLFVIPYAQLPEMIYILPIAFSDREGARIVNFSFYLLTILLLFRYSKSEKNAKYAPLLFATAPFVMRYSSSQYTDFFMVFSFLLSALILSFGRTKEKFLSGLIFGATLSAKMWTVVYIPALIIYLWIIKRKIKYVLVFLLGIFLVSVFWQLRSFFLTGNPFFPFLSNTFYIGRNIPSSAEFGLKLNYSTLLFALKFNWLFLFNNAKILGPIFLCSVILLLLSLRKNRHLLYKNKLLPLFIILTILHLVINFYGRYLFAWYSLATIFTSYGITTKINDSKLLKFAVLSLSSLFIIYYFFRTVLLLPYGIGWANKERYLTRTLIMDNASYYDFDGKFGKFIHEYDLVATYDMESFYYANFKYLDVNFIFDRNNLSFDNLKKSGVTKLLIKGGDIKWFCEKLSLKSCDPSKTEYLSSYTNDHSFFLYQIK